MNNRFELYLDSLTPSKKKLAKEAIEVFLAGEGDNVENCGSSCSVWKRTRWLASKDVEHFVAIYMRKNCSIIKEETISFGCIDGTLADVRIILRGALLCGATCIACVHNHPSGSTKPSKLDDELTNRIKKACDIMSIRLVDHVIVTSNDWYSYRDEGKL